MNIALIGHGNVGAPLADPLQRLGHQVTRAAWDAASEAVRKARARLPALEAVAQEQALHLAHMTLLFGADGARAGALAGLGRGRAAALNRSSPSTPIDR